MSIQSLTTFDVEEYLRSELRNVSLIGMLEVSEEDWLHLGRLQRAIGRTTGFSPEAVPSTLFVATMVFTARHAGEEHRRFWQPYAKEAWGYAYQENTPPNFEAACRQRFIHACDELSEKLWLEFPKRTPGDVVLPVYFHAVLPSYVQPDFGEFCLERWQEIVRVPAEQLIGEVRADPRLQREKAPLRRLFESDVTRRVATDLLFDLATLIELYEAGDIDETAVRFDGVLPTDNPVVSSIFKGLLKNQSFRNEIHTVAGKSQQRSPHLIWNLDEHEMQVRVYDLRLTCIEKPASAVLLGTDETLAAASDKQDIRPWKGDGDSWWIEEIRFAVPDTTSQIVVLTDRESVVYRAEAPSVPSGPLHVFRETQQGLYGVHVDHTKPFSSGNWLVCIRDDVELRASDSREPTSLLESFPTPSQLNSIGHYSAGRIELSFPAKLVERDSDEVLLTLEARTLQVHQPALGGESQLAGTSPQVPPVFLSTRVVLYAPGIPKQLIGRFKLWLTSGAGRRFLSVRDLNEAGDIEVLEANDTLCIDLSRYLDTSPQRYSVELREGLRSIWSAPLEFAVIPGAAIDLPGASDVVFTPANPPSCGIRGINEDQILLPKGAAVESTGEECRIAWQAVDEPFEFAVQTHDDPIVVRWDLKTANAVLKGPVYEDAIDARELGQYYIEMNGPPNSGMFVKVDSGQERFQNLGASGTYCERFPFSPFADIVREAPSSRIVLECGFEGHRWPLATIQRRTEIDVESVSFDPGRGLVLTTNRETPWRGEFAYEVVHVRSGKPVHVGTANRVDRETVLRAAFTEGVYYLQLASRDRYASIQPRGSVFCVGVPNGVLPSSDEIKQFLRARSTQLVPPKDLPGYLEVLPRVVPFDQERFEAQELLQIATASKRALIGIPDSLLRDHWASLSSIREVADIPAWQSRHGLLPAWALTAHPLRFELGDDGHAFVVVDLISGNEKASRGTGKVRDSVKAKIEVDALIEWDPSLKHPGEVVIKAGSLPSGSSLQRCRAKLFESSAAPDYPSQPIGVVDREFAVRIADGDEIDTQLLSNRPSQLSTADGYRWAIANTIWGSKQDKRTYQAIKSRVSSQKLRKLYEKLEADIHRIGPAYGPAYGPLVRILTDLRNRDVPRRRILALEEHVLIIAALVRGLAYARQATVDLLDEAGTNLDVLAEELDFLDEHAPELLEWAFVWCELFFIHARS